MLVKCAFKIPVSSAEYFSGFSKREGFSAVVCLLFNFTSANEVIKMRK